MNINNQTRLNMVIGYPLTHSMSPILHNAVYQKLNINAVLLACPHNKIKPLINIIKTLSVGLTAVTMPFKEKVIRYLDKCSAEVLALKTTNTIINYAGELHGYNTDVDGIAYALRNINCTNKQALIIGAGGAARAVAYFLQKTNAKLFWLNRSKNKALNISKIFGGNVIYPKELNDLSIDIIVNTTPLGMYPHINESPLPNYLFHPQQVVFDLIYNPIDTALLKQAKLNGAKTISGMDMFIGQGFRQIELWLNKERGVYEL